MKLIKNGVFAFLATLAVVSAARAQDSTAVRLTLNEAVERALRNSPEIVRATGAITTSEWSERTAFGAFLPSLSASSGMGLNSSNRYNPQTQTTVTGSSQSYNAGVSANYDLFTGGRRGAELKRAHANTASAEAAMVVSRFSVTLNTKTAFFNVQRQQELLRVAQGTVQRSQEALDAAQRRLQVGSATRSDVLRAQLDLNNARQAVLNAQTQQRTAAYNLGVLVGVTGPVGVTVDSLAVPRALPLTDEQLVAHALDNAPTVLTAEAAITTAQASSSVARAQYFPSLRASSGYDWSNSEARFDNGNTSWNLRFSLSYPLFNGFSRESQVANADVQVRNATSTLANAQRQVAADVQRVLGQLRLAEQQVALAGEALEVAREDLRVNQERYRLGMATILDLLLSQTNLRSAESDVVGTRYDYEIARAQLESLIGRQL
jgi:TolC family type I secretion outer membrane protein